MIPPQLLLYLGIIATAVLGKLKFVNNYKW